MDTIKLKWKNYTLQKRLRELWEEYKKVSHLSDDPETLQKFKEFLEQANETMRQFAKQNDKQLDELLGDANQILECILAYLSQFPDLQKRYKGTDANNSEQILQDIMDQCVQLAEQILRDPKYKKNVEHSHNLLADFLNLIEKAQKNESKAILVKLLILFSDNLNQRIEFFEQQGFHKLLQILLARDPKLNRVISKALLHFLAIEDINSLHFEEDTDDPQHKTIKQKLTNIAGYLRQFAFKELQKVFLPRQEDVLKQEPESTTQPKAEILTLQQAIEQNISPQKLFEVDLAFYMNSQTQSRSTSDQDTSQIIEKFISESSSPLQPASLALERTQSEELVKEFQVLQGGFKAILETLMKATTEVQMDLLQTIKQILQTNARNKFEFKRVNGYQLLSELISTKNDQEFDKMFFEFLKAIIVTDGEIQDYDGFTLLLELLPVQFEKVMEVLSELLHSNWRNVLIAKKLKLNFYLAIVQLRQYFNSSDMLQLVSRIENEYVSNNFKQLLSKMHFQQTATPQIQLYEVMNQLEGFYSLEFEAIQSQLAICLMQDSEKYQQILNLLFANIKLKIEKKCRIINSFDHLQELVFKNFCDLFKNIYEEYLSIRKHQKQYAQSAYINFIQIMEIINQFLVCDHQIQVQEGEYIKNLVSQNRCEQFMRQLKPLLAKIKLQSILELFEFEHNIQQDLGATHLQFRLNQALFVFLQGVISNSDCMVDPQMAFYLTYSQYEMWLALQKHPSNPLNEILDFLIFLTKKNSACANSIWMLMNKVQLDDSCAPSIENILQLFKQQSHLEAIGNLLLILSRSLPSYSSFVNLYPATLQYIETFLNKADLEPWLDFIFSGEIIKKLVEPEVGASYSDLLSLITIHCMFQGALYEKMVVQEYLTNALETLYYTSSNEQSVKLVYVLYLLNQKAKSRNPNYSTKNKYFQLILKLLTSTKVTNQLCNTVYKLVFWNFDSYHVLYTENSSNVSSVMVRSEFAELIQKTQKSYLENKQPIQQIVNLEILELFFLLLQKNPSDNYIFELLKIFESILSPVNMTILLESAIFQWLTSLSRDARIAAVVQQIIRSLILFDLQRPTKHSKVVELLRRLPNSAELILDFLKHLQTKPIIQCEPQNFLRNFLSLVQNFDELVGFSEEIDVLLFQIVNLMASKNTPNVRDLLKQLGFFEIRDTLALQVLRYKMEPQQLMDLLSGIPFSQLCSQKQFKESHCMAYLLKRLIQNRDFGLQILIIKILKYDVAQSEDNRKYVAKLLQNESLLAFFFPNYRKSSKSLKCFDQEDSKNQRSSSPEPELLGPNTTVDAFLNLFFGERFGDERKQIELAIDKTLIPVESEAKKQQSRLNAKKQNRLQRLEEQSEELKVQTQINEWEIKIQQRLKRCQEKHKVRQLKLQEYLDQSLAEGENQWFKLCLNQ